MPSDVPPTVGKTQPEIDADVATEGPRATLPDLETCDGDGATGARQTLPDHTADEPSAEDADAGDADADDVDAGDAGADDPDPNAPPQPKARDAWVYFLIGGLLFASIAGPLVFYFVAWRARPTAVAHIPKGTTVAVRFDGVELYANAAFRKHVVSVLEEGSERNTLVQQIKQYTNINLTSDVREVVVATTAGDSYLLLIGGHFIKARLDQKTFPEGLRRALLARGVDESKLVLEDGVLTLPGGLLVAQAEDTTIIVAMHRSQIDAALPASEERELLLASSGGLSFVIDAPAVSAIAGIAPPAGAKALSQTQRLSGYYTVRKSRLFIEVLPKPGVDVLALSQDVEAALAQAGGLSLLLPNLAGERSALLAARSKPRVDTVLIETEWPRKEIDQGFERLGQALRLALGLPSEAPL